MADAVMDTPVEAGTNVESQQDTTSTEVDTSKQAAESPSGTGTPETKESGEAAPETDAAVEALLAKQSKDLARMAGALKNLQAENATLKGSGVKDSTVEEERQPQTARMRATPTGTSQKLANHPALQGLDWGEEGTDYEGMVEVDGEYITPKTAIRLYNLESRQNEHDQWRQSQESAAHDAKVQKASGEFFDAVSSTMTDMLKEAMPTLADAARPRVQKLLLQEADTLFESAMASGEEITPELIQRVGKQALGEVRLTLGVLGEQQFKSNQEAAAKDKVRPGHVTGVPKGKKPEQMTESELNAYSKHLSEIAEAALKGE